MNDQESKEYIKGLGTDNLNEVGFAVYGSLREGDYNYDRLLKHSEYEKTGSGKISGYEMISLGSYPGIIKADNESKIIVDFFDVIDKESVSDNKKNTFFNIHLMEIGAGYYPTIIERGGKKYILYVFNEKYLYGSKTVVESGDWIKHKYGKVKQREKKIDRRSV